jgi:macrolide-specific efflux system membrane fusion protein
MSAEADIVVAERSNVLLVPNRAVKRDSQGNPMVKVMVDEEIEERSVVVGISDDFQTEIITGLSEGEMVVEN